LSAERGGLPVAAVTPMMGAEIVVSALVCASAALFGIWWGGRR